MCETNRYNYNDKASAVVCVLVGRDWIGTEGLSELLHYPFSLSLANTAATNLARQRIAYFG